MTSSYGEELETGPSREVWHRPVPHPTTEASLGSAQALFETTAEVLKGSAGVAMATAIVSVMTGIPVRRDVAMTGEITLRGRVWPIAGLKEKLLAALRGGIKTVLIPHQNRAHSRRERQGSCRNRGQHQEWARDRSGLAHGRGARPAP